MKVKYKFLVFFFLLIFATTNIIAQQKHFIYIQADNKQPFYVMLNGKNYSSSSIGYIILSKLDNGTYTLRVGFPKNMYSEQSFNVTVDNNDYGYALKNFGDKGWGLFNLQTMDVVMANTGDTTSNSVALNEQKKPNRFGEILSDVVNDSTLTQNTATDNAAMSPSTTGVEVDTVNNQTATTAVSENNNTDTPAAETASAGSENTEQASSQPSDDVAENTDSSTMAESFDTKGVIKAEEKNTSNGTNLVFIDFNKSQNDTIQVFIPSESAQVDSEANATTANSTSSLSTSATNENATVNNDSSASADKNVTTIDNITSSSSEQPEKDSTKQVSNPFYSDSKTNVSSNNASSIIDNDSASLNVSSKKEMVNSTCNSMVDEKDIAKLKKKIVFETDADEMIQTVKKGLKGKCISTDNVKELGRLFITDESRYNFFDAIYPYVYDYGSFSSLENQLFDNYYRTRFKALLR